LTLWTGQAVVQHIDIPYSAQESLLGFSDEV